MIALSKGVLTVGDLEDMIRAYDPPKTMPVVLGFEARSGELVTLGGLARAGIATHPRSNSDVFVLMTRPKANAGPTR